MRASRWLRTAGLVVLLGATALAGAQEDAGQALARAQGLLRQVSAQKQDLEVANARLDAEIDALRTQLARAESRLKKVGLELESAQRQAARTDGTLASTRERLAGREDTLREAIARLRDSNAALQQAQRDNAALNGEVARLVGELEDSERKNLDLYRLNVELLEAWHRKGPLTALLQREPVTGIGNVALENVLQEYRHKLDEALRESNRAAAGDDAAD